MKINDAEAGQLMIDHYNGVCEVESKRSGSTNWGDDDWPTWNWTLTDYRRKEKVNETK